MNSADLPLGTNPPALDFSHFPTRHQALIWKNWEMVTPKRLAEVLGATEENILDAAMEMGLNVPLQVNPSWLKDGYLTIIRNNWHLLDYDQLLRLLDWKAERLAYTLKEEDFLWIKLGSLKPKCEKLHFRDLTDLEKKRTADLKAVFQKHFPIESRNYQEAPFEFMSDSKTARSSCDANSFDFNFIHSFFTSCGDLLLDPESDPFPDHMLRQYASAGIKGLWFQAILYTLHPIKGAEEFSTGYQERLDNLSRLVTKCEKYGIQLFLYLNEPRCMPDAFYEKFPEWKGVKSEGEIAFTNCTSRTREPINWLEEACANVFSKVPGLGGAFFITMSENPTHCHSRFIGDSCPYCAERSPQDIIVEIIRAAENGIHSSVPDAKVIVWDWAWRRQGELPRNPDLEFEYEILEKLPSEIYFMCVSEWEKATTVGGIENRVIDYSISQVGPSRKSAALWKRAKELGMKTVAKVQVNNSWELSSVPYIPVPYLVQEHLENLRGNDIDGLMLSWTLGGYPDGNLMLLDKSPDEMAKLKFGNDAAPLVCDAWKIFSEAFKQFPFHIETIYFGPMNFGPMNILHLKNTNYRATMIGFPYDDLEKWRSTYPEAIFEEQFQKLSDGWKSGLEQLRKAKEMIPNERKDAFIDLENVATAAWCHFRSTYLQIKFVRLRVDAKKRIELKTIIKEELELAKTLHDIARSDSRIGFEASNHYYYSLNDLREKVLNCENILQE